MKVLDYDGLKTFKDYLLPYYIGSTPNYYRRASLPSSNRTTVTVYANTQVNIGNKGYISTKDTTLDISTVGSASERAGKDVYIYACQPESGTEPVFVLSMNSTVPDGYDENNSRKIGGFHCLCLAAGTLSDNDLSGYDTGDVLPSTHWDLRYRARGKSNEGFSFTDLGIWVGIYLPSYDGSKIVNAFGGEIITGTSSTPMHGEKFVEELGKQGWRLIRRDEFVCIAKGSNEGTNIQGSTNPGTTGGHVDTNGRRMMSKYGIEDCCGVIAQWAEDKSIATNRMFTSACTGQQGAQNGNANSGNYYISGLNWDDPNGQDAYTGENNNDTSNNGSCSRLYEPNIDGDNTGKFGDMYGCFPRCLAGGWYDRGSAAGSRSVYLNYLSASRYSHVGGRCVAEMEVVTD